MPTFRGIVERTRQRLHLGDKSFKPTPNVRNPCMLLEAEEYARHLHSFRNMLHNYEKHMSSFLSTLPLVCRTNLPRVWDSVEETNMSEPHAHEATSQNPYRTGGDYDEVLLADAAEIMRRRIEGIVKPIDRWLDSLSIVKHRMSRVEELRVEVDSRRRRVHKRWLKTLKHMTQGQVAALKAQSAEAMTRRRGVLSAAAPAGAPGDIDERGELVNARGGLVNGEAPMVGGGGYQEAGGLMTEPTAAPGLIPSAGGGSGLVTPRPGTPTRRSAPLRHLGTLAEGDELNTDVHRQREKEDYARDAISQQRHLDAVAESYNEQEQLVFEQLSGLVRDAAYFKSYLASSFLVLKDTMQATLVALGACKRPLPGFSEREPVEDSAMYGRVAPIDDMITSLPPIVLEGGRYLPHGARAPGAIAPEEVHPSRLTAQPLQVAADDLSSPAARYEPVPPVPKSPESSRIGTQVAEPTTPFFTGEVPGSYTSDVAPTSGLTGSGGLTTGIPTGTGSGGLTTGIPTGEYGYGTPGYPGTATLSKGEPGTGSSFPALQQAVAH